MVDQSAFGRDACERGQHEVEHERDGQQRARAGRVLARDTDGVHIAYRPNNWRELGHYTDASGTSGSMRAASHLAAQPRFHACRSRMYPQRVLHDSRGESKCRNVRSAVH